jgi:hypothetical protein
MALIGSGLLALGVMAVYARRAQRRRPAQRVPSVRDAGPENMRSQPRRWERQDQRIDESFPASDPPATY